MGFWLGDVSTGFHPDNKIAPAINALADAEFARLPDMVDCPARRALDNGLSEILGLPNLAGLRRLLASEPVVSNRRL